MLLILLGTLYFTSVFVYYFSSLKKHPKFNQFLFITDVAIKIAVKYSEGTLGTKFTVQKNKNVVEIVYSEKGKGEKKLLIPSNRKIGLERSRCQYFLVTNGQRKIIDVSPEFPILVSAQDMGGESIEIHDLHGKLIRRTHPSEVPYV